MEIYLEFESPIKELRQQIEKLKESETKNGIDVHTAIEDLERAVVEKTNEIYSNLTPWERVLVSRHPERPYTLQYIETITETSGAITSFFPAPENDSRSVRKKLSNFSFE
jgi:acetyl-CoA carboxylase carboxyl transferase subunit alpha